MNKQKIVLVTIGLIIGTSIGYVGRSFTDNKIQPGGANCGSNLDCITRAFQNCEDGFTTTLKTTTVEGDPVSFAVDVVANEDKSKGCSLGIVEDASQDSFRGSNQRVFEATCKNLLLDEHGRLLASACTGEIPQFLLPV